MKPTTESGESFMPDYFKEWIKTNDCETLCEIDCPFLKDGFCTYYNYELDECLDRYILCPDCYDDCHAEV